MSHRRLDRAARSLQSSSVNAGVSPLPANEAQAGTFPAVELPAKTTRKAKGFTLVELLVVIGIIAILIGIILPSLASARRSANSLKCLAALKEIGNAFKMYAIDYKGVWPVAAYRLPDADNTQWSAWTDSIAKYVHKGMVDAARGDISKVRRNSVLWGCPEWTRSFDYSAADSSISSTANYTGYGMNYLPPPWFAHGQAVLADQAIVTASVAGTYCKYTTWNEKGSDRLLIADSQVEFIYCTPTYSKATILFQPYDPANFGTPNFWVDAARHAKPGISKKNVFSIKSFNALFCDGHAQSVSVADAWNAIQNPGSDATKP